MKNKFIFAVSSVLLLVMLSLTGCGMPQSGNNETSNANDSLNIEGLKKAIGRNYIVAVASGNFHSLALTNDGRVFGTGDNSYGQLGLTEKRLNEWIYTGLDNVKSIACGANHSMALRNIDGGQVWVAGYNYYGQLALRDNNNRSTWSSTPSSNVSAISAGEGHSVFLCNGVVWVTGRNSTGQLGLGDNNDRNQWTATNAGNVIAIAAGYYHTLCIRNLPGVNGQVWATGFNADGQLAVGGNITRYNWTSTLFTNVTAIAAGPLHSACIRMGTVFVSGANHTGQLGLGDNNRRYYWTNTQQHGVTSIACGLDYTIFLRNGTVFSTGKNNEGQLGLGDYDNRNVFTRTNSAGLSSIACGWFSSFYLADGGVYSCGNNNGGQLGIGNYVNPVNFWVHCP